MFMFYALSDGSMCLKLHSFCQDWTVSLAVTWKGGGI